MISWEDFLADPKLSHAESERIQGTIERLLKQLHSGYNMADGYASEYRKFCEMVQRNDAEEERRERPAKGKETLKQLEMGLIAAHVTINPSAEPSARENAVSALAHFIIEQRNLKIKQYHAKLGEKTQNMAEKTMMEESHAIEIAKYVDRVICQQLRETRQSRGI